MRYDFVSYDARSRQQLEALGYKFKSYFDLELQWEDWVHPSGILLRRKVDRPSQITSASNAVPQSRSPQASTPTQPAYDFSDLSFLGHESRKLLSDIDNTLKTAKWLDFVATYGPGLVYGSIGLGSASGGKVVTDLAQALAGLGLNTLATYTINRIRGKSGDIPDVTKAKIFEKIQMLQFRAANTGSGRINLSPKEVAFWKMKEALFSPYN